MSRRLLVPLCTAIVAGCSGAPTGSQPPVSAPAPSAAAQQSAASRTLPPQSELNDNSPDAALQTSTSARAASNFRRSDGEQTNDANAFLSTISAFNPASRVRADIFFRDNGTTLKAYGLAVGMVPGANYISFIYGTGSTAAGPQTQRCLPPTPNNLTFNQMVLGYWQPVNSSIRTLVAVKTGTNNAPADYAPLSSFATTSVRLDTQFGQPLTVNPSPARYVLQACGAVRPTQGDD